MKTIKQIGILFLSIAISSFALSCSSDSSDGGGGGSAANGTIVAKVAGADFASSTMATTAVLSTSGTFQILTIQGSQLDMSGSGTTKNIQLIIQGVDIEVGAYDIGGDNLITVVGTYMEVSGASSGNFVTSYWVAPYDEAESVVGKVTITEITATNVKGTFNFTGQKQNEAGDWDGNFKEVTNGSFNVDFTQF